MAAAARAGLGLVIEAERVGVDRSGVRSWAATALDIGRAHPVAVAFAVALVLRVVVAIGMAVVLDSSPIQDDQTYIQMASEMADGDTSRWIDFTHTLYWATATFLVPLTALYELFGGNELVGQLLAALFGAATAAAVARLALEVVDRGWALAAGVAVAALPSQVFFTSLTLKDGTVWAIAASIAILVGLAQRVEPRRLPVVLAGVAALVFFMAHARIHSLVVVSWALLLVSPLGRRDTRALRVGVLVAVAVVVPWFSGYGPLGIDHIRNSSSLSDYRQAQSTGNLAIDGPKSDTEPDDPVAAPTEEPAADTASDGGIGGIGHLPRGLSVMLFEPYPWQRAHNLQVWLAKGETLLWYPLLAMAVAGLVSVVRRRIAVAAFPLLVGGAMLLIAALAEGNIGTAFRHRGEFVWVVVLLAVIGGRDWLVPAAQRRRSVYRSSS